jgi:hypothetical protein
MVNPKTPDISIFLVANAAKHGTNEKNFGKKAGTEG